MTSPRGPLRLMIDPAFGAIFWGKLVTAAGVWMHSIVAAIVVFDATGSALMVALVSVAQFAPQLFLTPISGTWADRGSALRQIILGRLLCTAGSASLALWIWVVPDADAAAPVLLCSLLVGLGFVVGGPAMQSIVPLLIRPGEMATAMALNTTPMMAARICGPVLGALVAAHMGPAAAFGFAAGSHVLFGLLLVIVRFPIPKPHRVGVDYSVRAALRHMRRDRPLLLLLVGITAVGFGSEPSLTLAPAMAQELGGGPRLVGELSTAFGVGAALGLVVISVGNRWIRAATWSTTGLWLIGLGLVGVSASPTALLALSSFVIAGLGFTWAVTAISTLVHERTPDELRGRIMALWMVGFIGSRPLAAALVGTASDVLSVRMAFVIAALPVAVVALKCRPTALVGPPRS